MLTQASTHQRQKDNFDMMAVKIPFTSFLQSGRAPCIKPAFYAGEKLATECPAKKRKIKKETRRKYNKTTFEINGG